MGTLVVSWGSRAVKVKAKLRLTGDERKLLSLVASGLDDQEIAAELGKTEHVVTASVEGLIVKTHTQNRIELALFGLAKARPRLAESNRS